MEKIELIWYTVKEKTPPVYKTVLTQRYFSPVIAHVCSCEGKILWDLTSGQKLVPAEDDDLWAILDHPVNNKL